MKCLIERKCGSCKYINVEYNQQLEIKTNYCKDLLKNNNLNMYKVEKIKGMQYPYEYRNKIIVAFNQKYEFGFYEENSHRIIPYNRCLLHEEVSDLIIKKIQSLLKRYRVSIYDEKRQRGLLRHVLIRRAIVKDQTMIVLVCNDNVFKGSKNFCNELVKSFPSIKTVVLNVNKRKTSIVLGNEEKVLYGKGFIVDELCGLTFKISPKSFYQINHEQCQALYNKAIDLLELKGNEIVIDAYCGIGTIGMVAAKKALTKAKNQNIKRIVATPHIIPGTTNDLNLIKQRINDFIKLAKEYGIIGYCGSEVMLNDECLIGLQNDLIIPINNGPYVLVEFNLSRKINGDCLDYLYEYSLKHKLVIAHVERYFYKDLDLSMINSWIKQGHIIQVNSSSFLGENGSKIKKNAYKLLEKGLIHVIANDTHRASRHRFPNLHDTYELLSKKYEEKNIRQLMYDNPLAIINGKEVLPVQVKKLSLFKRRK